MRFSSRRDLMFSIIYWGSILVLVGTSTLGIYNPNLKSIPVWVHILDGTGIIFLLWLFYGTNYELSDGLLKYKSGPFSGSIEINDIKEIVEGKTSWVGNKPATATNGLIIKHGKFKDEIYISPNSNELFVKEIIKINPEVKIVQP